MAVYKGKPEKRQCTVRTMVGVLVAVLLLTAGQAMAQLTSEGNQFWHQDSDGIAGRAEPGDNFGRTVAAADFNNDDFDDLAIGVLFESVEGEEGAGAVNVIYGGPQSGPESASAIPKLETPQAITAMHSNARSARRAPETRGDNSRCMRHNLRRARCQK